VTAQSINVVDWRESFDAPLSCFGLRVSFYQLQQVLIFESCECLFVQELKVKVLAVDLHGCIWIVQ
jgi:hypothetical protein